VAEPLVSHVTTLGSGTAYLPGVAGGGLTQASQAGLLPPDGGGVLRAWRGRAERARPVRRVHRCRVGQGEQATQGHVLGLGQRLSLIRPARSVRAAGPTSSDPPVNTHRTCRPSSST
jgi:hypothetical protein